MKHLRNAFSLATYNWSVLWRFELVFLLGGFLLISLVAKGLAWLAMSASSLSYLSGDNLSVLLTNPLTWICAIVLILVCAFICLFEVSALIFLFDVSRQKIKVNLKEVFSFAGKNSARLFKNKGKNLSIIGIMIVLMPLLGMGVLGTLFGSISLPEFISEAIEKNSLYSGALVVLVIVLVVLAIRWVFTLHYYTLDNMNSREARRASVAVSIKTRFFSLLIVALVIGVIALVIFAIIAGLIIALVGVYLSLNLSSLLACVLLAALAVMIGIIILGLYILLLTASTLALSVAFYYQKEKRAESLQNLPAKEEKLSRSLRIVTWVLTVLVALLISGLLAIVTNGVATGTVNPSEFSFIKRSSTTEITAHRGGSHSGPENTMAAFKKADEQQADWVELDVQMSKDGVLFVMHDSSFARTCGVDKNTWDLTWEEIQTLDASYGWSEYAGEHVPSLEEVIDWAKETGMKLNIEIKPTGHEPSSIEEAVVAMIQNKDFKNQCWVASLDYSVLETVKSIDPTMPTLLNMVLAYGDIAQMPAADNYSLESTNVSDTITEDVHKANKQLAVWTVNDENNMADVLMYDIDNIVTDEVVTAKKQVQLYSNQGIARIIETFAKSGLSGTTQNNTTAG